MVLFMKGDLRTTHTRLQEHNVLLETIYHKRWYLKQFKFPIPLFLLASQIWCSSFLKFRNICALIKTNTKQEETLRGHLQGWRHCRVHLGPDSNDFELICVNDSVILCHSIPIISSYGDFSDGYFVLFPGSSYTTAKASGAQSSC